MSNVITKKDKDKVLNYMINQNDKTYNILKAAEELQVPLGTFKTLIHRGSARLKEQLRRSYQ